MTVVKTQLAIADVTAGMVLAERLLDAQGQVLLPQGTVLTDATLAALHRRSIESLAVAVASGPEPDPQVAEKELLLRLERLFRKFDGTCGHQLLRSAVSNYRLGRHE